MPPSALPTSPTAACPTIEELLRSFEDYATTLLAFQKAHTNSGDGRSPFVVIGDEIALMATRRVVLARFKRNLDAYRYVTEETAPGHPRTPEPVAGPSRSRSFPTPPSNRVDLQPVTTIQTTSALVNDVQSPSPVHFPKSPPDSPIYPRMRPLERENAFYGWEMLKRYDFVRSRSVKPSFVGTTIQALAPGSPDPQKPSSVAARGSVPAAAAAAAPVPSTTAISGPSDPPNSEAAVVTRVTRSSARRNNAAASGDAPSSSPSSTGKGKKRPSDDVDGNADSGAANLPPAKRRKKLHLKIGDTSK